MALGRAEKRWRILAEAQPDLGAAIDLQRILVRRSVELFEQLDKNGVRAPALGSRAPEKLREGAPLLQTEDVPLPLDLLTPAALDFCRALEAAGAGKSAARIAASLTSQRLDASSLFKASLARADCAISEGAMQLNVAPDALWLIGELTMAPFAYVLQRRLLSSLPPDALDEWRHGYCPVCGSWPAFGAAVEQRFSLVCSFCAATWPRPGDGCIYCGEEGDPFSIDRQIETCSSCSGYLKSLAVDAPIEFPLTAVEDLATADLDAAAAERGFRRPPLKKFQGS